MVLSALLVSLIFLPVKSCKKEPEEPIYTKLARMDGGFNIADTSKPQIKPKIIRTTYVLSGSDTLFNILWMQVVSPGDVTPNNRLKIQEWIQKSLKTDTTQSK